jgi:hypothetical protein
MALQRKVDGRGLRFCRHEFYTFHRYNVIFFGYADIRNGIRRIYWSKGV